MIDEDKKLFTDEQNDFITTHLRNPDNEKAIAEIAFLISEELEKAGGSPGVSPSIVKQTALLMNLGEIDERIKYIYDPDYVWKKEDKELNALHGKYSVEMAEKIGIELTDEQKSVISGHSKGEYSSILAQIIKSAEICRATEKPRWSRGVRKEPATSWQEVKTILEEGISIPVINLTQMSYGKNRFPQKSEIEEDKSVD